MGQNGISKMRPKNRSEWNLRMRPIYPFEHSVQALHKGQSEGGRRGGIEADGEDVGVSMVETKLCSQAGHHELKVSKGWDTCLYAGRLVEEGGTWGEKKMLERKRVCVCVWGGMLSMHTV